MEVLFDLHTVCYFWDVQHIQGGKRQHDRQVSEMYTP